MIYHIMGIHEIETGKEAYNEEQYKRIGESKQKSCSKIAPICICRFHFSLVQCPRGVAPEEIYSIYDQHCRAGHLQNITV